MSIRGGFEIDIDMVECRLPDEVKKAFDEVYGSRVGCRFIPVLYCGRQLVAGMNYMIICRTAPAVLHPELAEELVKVVIYAPLPNSGEPCREISRETLIERRVTGGIDGVSLSNPYVEYRGIFQAEYAAHVCVYISSKLHDTGIEHIYVIGGKVVELDFKNGLCLREAMGVCDISGDYHTYSVTKHFSAVNEMIGRCNVLAKGDEKDRFHSILWHNGTQSFSLRAPEGMSEAEIKGFIETLSVVD